MSAARQNLDHRLLPPVLAPQMPFVLVVCAATFAILVGFLSIMGWTLDWRRLTDWWNDGISMFPNTAVCSVLCGVSLLGAINRGSRRALRVVRLLAALAAVIGGLTLFEHATGVNLGIDTLLLQRNWGQRAAVASMRMGPPAAISFLFLGVALTMATGNSQSRRNATAVAMLPIVVSSLSIIGYLLDANQLFGIAKFTGIARQTSLVIAALGFGVIGLAPEHGLMAALRRKDTGGLVLRYFLAPIVLLPILLGWVCVAGLRGDFYDAAFGVSLLILAEVSLLIALLWWASRSISVQSKRAKDVSLRLGAIVATTSDAVIGKKLDGTIESWNVGATQLFGYTPDEAIGRNITMLIPADRLSEEDHIQSQLRRGQTIDSYETIRLRKDGSEVHISITVSPILDAAGNIVGASKIARDITHRIQAESALKQSEAEMRALADSIPQLAWMAAPDGHIFWYNEQWYAYTGTTLEDMAGWGWQSVHDPQLLPDVLKRWKASLATGEPFEMEFPLRAADGTFRWFLTRCRPLRDSSGKVVRWFGTNTDVEEVKQKELALERKTHTLELLNNAGRLLGGKLELDELLQSVTDVATKVSEAQFGAFFYNSRGEDGNMYMLFALSGADREAFEKFGMPRETPLFGPTFAGHAVIRSDDITADPRYGRMAPHHGMPKGHLPVRSYLAAPVMSRMGEVIGGLFFGHPEAGRFTEETERVIEGIAAQAAVAIDNARLYENLKNAAAEREELLAAERSARADAERLNVMKDEFLATLSHELRTPLNAIMGWSQILTMDDVSDNDFQEGLEAIERNARAQTQLIEDLLDMSRIVSGKVRLSIQPVNVIEVLEQSLESVRPTADTKEINLTSQFADERVIVRGDGVRLQQVFWNLLSNAIKFTPRGGSVEVGAQREGDYLAISVKDSGIGISPEVLHHIFERFRQADSSTTRRYGGLGLGLSIVKNLVEIHGGTVHAESGGADQGSSFTVYLPVRKVKEDPRGAGSSETLEERAHEPTVLAGVRVLVVDDEPDARLLLQRILKQHDTVVDMAASAREGLTLIEQAPPDLIVSDIGMPEMDGYEFIRQVRRLEANTHRSVPAIALTAFARNEDRQRALDAGYDAYLVKPVHPHEMTTLLVGLLSPN